jgi:predicted lysophospholipase L1 biosynthesis ABC-type transport system permease subunit
MVVDRNTAMYALKLYRPGDRLTVRDGQGGEAVLEVAALLQGSVLQGSLIVGEDNFLRLFPEESGTRFFLLRTGGGASERRRAEEQLESALEDFGFAAVDARQRLAELMAVQNTYLATFQTLGGLGLLLGAVGLGVAQLRSVLERRQELALLRAVGFSRGRLARLVLWENCAAIVGGAGMGCAAAAAATLPHALANQASPPWWTLGGLLAATALTGLATGALAIRAALRAPLWAVLRDA